MGYEDLTPKNDLIFKAVFGDPRHPELTCLLFNALFNEDLMPKDITFENTELVPEFVDGKKSLLDICVRTAEGKYYDLKIQQGTVLTAQ